MNILTLIQQSEKKEQRKELALQVFIFLLCMTSLILMLAGVLEDNKETNDLGLLFGASLFSGFAMSFLATNNIREAIFYGIAEIIFGGAFFWGATHPEGAKALNEWLKINNEQVVFFGKYSITPFLVILVLLIPYFCPWLCTGRNKRKKIDVKELECTAVHETGHVAIYKALWGPEVFCSMRLMVTDHRVPADGVMGLANASSPKIPVEDLGTARKIFRQNMLKALGGSVAEEVMGYTPLEIRNLEGSPKSDYDLWRQAASIYCESIGRIPESWLLFKIKSEQVTLLTNFFTRNKWLLERCSKAMIEKGELSGEELDKLFLGMEGREEILAYCNGFQD